MKIETLFLVEDKIFKQAGLYALWTLIFVSNFVVLLCDGTVDESRHFNVLVNGFSVVYGSVASVNTIYGNKLPSTLLLVGGPLHQYLYWILFAYFKGTPVLGRHPIGVMNWVSTVVVGFFTLDMVIKTWVVTLYPNSYLEYSKNNDLVDSSLEIPMAPRHIKEQKRVSFSDLGREESKEDKCQKVIATFKFKPGLKDKFVDLLKDPENGLSLTRKSPGFISIDCMVGDENPNVIVLSQVWQSKQDHLDYLAMRTEMGLFDQLNDMLEDKPDIKYLSSV